MKAKMKIRELWRVLRDHQCKELRRTGSHSIFQLPDGNTLTLNLSHPNEDIGNRQMKWYRRNLNAAGIEV